MYSIFWKIYVFFLLDGKTLPKGCSILISPFFGNRNSEIYEKPEDFNPDRIELTQTGKNPYSYLPFSAGPRNCIGWFKQN